MGLAPVRRASVAFFLGDPAFLSDSKFRALARRLPDPDDFNSAVGAYWILVATCRRNGSPVVDAEAETGSRHLGVLREVGLLTDEGLPRAAFEAWAPMSPQQAAAGKARAAKADRDERGQFVKAPAPSSALDHWTSAVQPSPPFPSTPTEQEPARDEEPEWPVMAWLARHRCDIRPGDGYHRKLIPAVERHGAPAMVEALEALSDAGTPDGDLKGLLWRAIDELDAAKRPPPGAVAQVAESRRSNAEVQATKRRIAVLQSIPPAPGSLADHGILRPGIGS